MGNTGARCQVPGVSAGWLAAGTLGPALTEFVMLDGWEVGLGKPGTEHLTPNT